MKIKKQTLTLTATSAALYVVLGLAFAPISFGPIQSRVANILIPFCAALGFPLVLGTTLGTIILNTYGYAIGIAVGPLDLLSPFIFIAPKVAIWKLGLKGVWIHVLFVGLWVGFMLHLMYGLPFFLSAVLVGAGEAISEGVGVVLVATIRKRNFFERITKF